MHLAVNNLGKVHGGWFATEVTFEGAGHVLKIGEMNENSTLALQKGDGETTQGLQAVCQREVDEKDRNTRGAGLGRDTSPNKNRAKAARLAGKSGT